MLKGKALHFWCLDLEVFLGWQMEEKPHILLIGGGRSWSASLQL